MGVFLETMGSRLITSPCPGEEEGEFPTPGYENVSGSGSHRVFYGTDKLVSPGQVGE